LKAKLIRNTRRVGFTTRHTIPTSTITSSGEPTTSQIILKSFRDLLPPDALEQTKPLAKELFGIARVTLDPGKFI
ncbi:jg26545, partial [Pararge aegeria aegeria]